MAAASLCPIPDHADKQVLGAKSQPQHRLPCLVPRGMERAGQPSPQDRDTLLALGHGAMLCDPNTAHAVPAGLCSAASPGMSLAAQQRWRVLGKQEQSGEEQRGPAAQIS